MLQIEWSTNYCTGIRLLDTQNKHTFEMLKLLFEFQREDPGPDMFHQLFRQTVNHLEEHFQEEEQFYQKHAPQELDSHRLQHQDFLQALDHRCNDLTETSGTLCEYVLDWMIFHILNFDKNAAYSIKSAV